MMENRATRPNIIVFFTDQQRWDTCGCYNPQNRLTPNLDKIAAQGARFEYAYTCQPVCGPARAALQTGLYPTETGCYRNNIRLEPKYSTIAHCLNAEGYETGYVGKWHLANVSEGPVPVKYRGGYRDCWKVADMLEYTSLPYEGFVRDENDQKVFFKDRFRADFITDLSIDFLKSRSGEKPFFLFQSLIECHHQNILSRYVAPDGYAESCKDAWVPGDLAAHPGEGDWEKELPDYYGMVKNIDENFGRMLDALHETKQMENTVILFISDHGSHFCTRNGEYKRSCHDACSRIPMIIHGPGFTGGKVIKEKLASLIDIPPTILDIAGARIPRYMQGLSLKDVFDSNIPWRSEIFMQISESQVGRAIFDGRFKYAVHAPEKDAWEHSCSDVYEEQFLYDLHADPDEQMNLVLDPGYMEERRRLRVRLIEQVERIERYTPEVIAASSM